MFLLEVANITKRFGATLALNEAQLQLARGEIHAVVGENGAGKSTLMKILSGVHTADAGEIVFEGRSIAPATPREALALGIAIVHQELSVVPALTVAENIFPGRLPTNALGMVRFRTLFAQAQRVLEDLQVDLDPRALVGDLSIANQQLVEIAKALSLQCKLLILDEPTSALTEREAEVLFGLLRRLAADGVGILYISHKLSEIFALAHRITVLRDGHYIGTREVSATTTDEIVRMMVGRDLGDFYPPKSTTTGGPLLEVRNLRLPGSAAHNSFTLYRGEILGFAGLIGSGRTELARAIFGADIPEEGEIALEGQLLRIRSPWDAIRRKIGYLPEDRKAAGLFLDMAIRQNIDSSNLREVTRYGFVLPGRETRLAERYVRQLNISTPHVEQEVRRLSGGNQQKTLLSKWLAIQPRILIVDEPTRGIDVGAKREIHFLLRSLAESGVGVIMISSELPEILGMSDRVMVMHGGAIVAELSGAEATEERIMHYASGQQMQAAIQK
jgi:ABC-type sugar transport system ATPase subunit